MKPLIVAIAVCLLSTSAIADEPMCQENCQAFSEQPPAVEVEVAIEPARPLQTFVSTPIKAGRNAIQAVATPVVRFGQAVAERRPTMMRSQPIRRVFARKPLRKLLGRILGYRSGR